MPGFAASVRLNSAKILLEVNNNCYTIARDLFTEVVHTTPSPSNPGPYAKGLLANQWYPGQSGFSTEVSTALSPNGQDSLNRIDSLVRGLAFDNKDATITFANNLDYAYQAEADGWARTAPYRMVALSLQKIAAKYQ